VLEVTLPELELPSLSEGVPSLSDLQKRCEKLPLLGPSHSSPVEGNFGDHTTPSPQAQQASDAAFRQYLFCVAFWNGLRAAGHEPVAGHAETGDRAIAIAPRPLSQPSDQPLALRTGPSGELQLDVAQGWPEEYWQEMEQKTKIERREVTFHRKRGRGRSRSPGFNQPFDVLSMESRARGRSEC
jgi:hypothetical protein